MPVQENTTAGRFLDKRGGEGGYMVIVDSSDFEKEQARVESSGIEIVGMGIEKKRTFKLELFTCIPNKLVEPSYQ